MHAVEDHIVHITGLYMIAQHMHKNIKDFVIF